MSMVPAKTTPSSSAAEKLSPREKLFCDNVHVARGHTAKDQQRNVELDARALAAAETWAKRCGYRFDWTLDPHPVDTLSGLDPEDVSEVWSVAMVDSDGVAVQKMCAVVVLKTWTRKQAQRERHVHEAHMALAEMTARQMQPRQGRRTMSGGQRIRNSHSPTESARKYASAVARADEELARATQMLRRRDGRGALAAIMQTVYWTAIARAERSYAGPDAAADARLQVLETGMAQWDENYINAMVGAWKR